MNPSIGFTKAYDKLIGLGLPKSLVLLYGQLEFMAGDKGECWPTHSTLARKLHISRRQVIRLLETLQRLELIEWKRGRYFNRYRVLKLDVTRVSHLIGHGCHISDVTRMSHRKESSSKKRTSKRTPPTPSAEKPGASAGTKPKAKSKVDDDEPKARSPQEEFQKRVGQRHGVSFDADACLKRVQRELGKCTGLGLAEFLAFDQTRTTGQRFSNANGYYIHLARELVKLTIEQARGTWPAESKRDSKGPCVRCAAGRLKGGGYCDCPMGRDLALVERRKPKSEKPSARGAA
jgi:Helix-turn-helix domain